MKYLIAMLVASATYVLGSAFIEYTNCIISKDMDIDNIQVYQTEAWFKECSKKAPLTLPQARCSCSDSAGISL